MGRIGSTLILLFPSSLAAQQAAPANEYIDASICAGCHRQIALGGNRRKYGSVLLFSAWTSK
jgi:hypothetical protein